MSEKSFCENCNKEVNWLSSREYNNMVLCLDCYNLAEKDKLTEFKIKNILVTSTYWLQNYNITKYFDIVTSDCNRNRPNF